MSNQNDNNFNDDSDLDDIFTSTDDPMNETGIQDAVEDTIDDISDYDDSEDGIFAPAPQKKKSAGASSALLGTVAAVAVLAAGGFYVYKNPGLIESLTGGSGDVAVAPDVVTDAPVEQAAAPAETPAPAETAPTEPAPDQELASIPQPQAIMNVEDAARTAQATPEQTATPETPAPVPVEEQVADVDTAIPVLGETPVDAAPVTPVSDAVTPAPASEAPAPVVATETAPTEPAPAIVAETPVPATPTPDMPPPPTPDETQAAIQPVTPAPVAETPAPVGESKTPEVVSTPAPKQEVLAEAPVAPKEQEKPKAVETPKVTKPAKAPETVYFDAPKGKALTDLPTPSMNTKRGKNESIIIVGKNTAPTSAAGTVTTSTQESGVIAAGRALRLGRYDAALDMYNDLYRANPRDSRILMGRAVALQKLGRSAEAIRAYEEAVEVDDDNPEAIVNLMGLVRKEYPALALEKLLNLRSRHPDNPGIAAQLGVAYADAGNLEDAAKYLMTASRMEPNNPQHYFNLGVVAERMQNRTRAIAYYEKALEVDAVYGNGRAINRDMIYDRLTRLRG